MKIPPPRVGQSLELDAIPGSRSEKLRWLYDAPSVSDAAGKIVIHWLCAPKVTTCVDDLARVLTLKENHTRVYVVAYIAGTKRDAQKLDPIREAEGVGLGTVAYGPEAIGMLKLMSLTGPASFVVDVDGKVALVTTSGAPADLDARDAKVNALAGAVRDYTAISDGPTTVKAGEKFELTLAIRLAGWLRYSTKPGTRTAFEINPPKDIKCDATRLASAQLKVSDQTLMAKVTCSGPRGSYEMRGQIHFGYDTPAGATGVGTDGASWKFEIK